MMIARTFAPMFCLAILAVLSVNVSAGVPCAGTSTVSAMGIGICPASAAATCPGGDYDYVIVTVLVKDCYGTPLQGQMVAVEPYGPICICPGEESKIAGPTDNDGMTSITFSKFGGCGLTEFYAHVGTVTIGPSVSILILGPDNNSDCVVDLVDFGNFATSYLTNDACSDYDCSGLVDLIDFGNFASHYLHGCSSD
jgi:hypothetical protein